MKTVTIAFGAVLALAGISGTAAAATFSGFSETSDVYFDDTATFDYDPFFVGGSAFDFGGLVNISLATDLGSGSLSLSDNAFNTLLDGSLSDNVLSVDNDIGDDTFAMLFELATGATSHAIATFTGDLDGFGPTDFFTDGVLFVDGNLRIVGASKDSMSVVPLPAGLPLLASGLFGLVWLRRRQASSLKVIS